MIRLKRCILSIVFTASCLHLFSQQVAIEGKVINEKTQEPLAFVNISFGHSNRGTASDIDGRFSFILENPVTELTFSYLGYETATIQTNNIPGYIVVALKERPTQLLDVIIRPDDNPALKIIRKAVANKAINNPENLSSFSYNCYNKLYSTLYETDGRRKKMTEKDSLRLKQFVEKNHLFVIESYTERKYRKPNYNQEVVLGNRMSGIKDPFFSFLATDFQPFTFYKDFIELFSYRYLNPVSKGSESRYDFTLVDTVFHGTDSVFVVTFEPLPGKSFDALKGQLYISSDGYAIEYVMAQLADDKALIESRIQQKYEKINGHWFPVQLNGELRLREYNIRNYKLRYVSRSYFRNIRIGDEINKKEFGLLNVKFDPDANFRSEGFWNDRRYDTLGRKEQNTYRLYDSLGDKLKRVNDLMTLTEGVAVGKLQVGKFYLPTEHLFRINQYEGFRLGVGFQTGERISKLISLEGNVGYGFKDKAVKYGGAIRYNFDAANDGFFKISYQQDIQEPGRANFIKPPGSNNYAESPRNWMTARMDSIEQYRVDLHFRPARFWQINLYGQHQWRNPAYAYQFLPNGDVSQPRDVFNITEFGIQGRFAFKETHMQIGQSKIVSRIVYPQVNVSLSKSFSGVLQGDFDFTKVEVKFDEQLVSRLLGRTTLQLASGYAWGEIPYPYLFNGKGTRYQKSFVETILVANYFQTMGLYEFVSDQYAYLFINHNFGRITGTKSKYIRPELSLVQNSGIGSLRNNGSHQGISFKTMEKGYFESGAVISSLLRINYLNLFYYGLGVGVFYRYGNYSLPKASDNIAFKVLLTLNF